MANKPLGGKQEILNAAARVFARKGFDATSVDEIAAKAKLAKGTIYYHFKTKDEIFITLIEQGIVSFTQLLHQKIQPLQTPSQQLHAFVSTQLDFFSKYQDFCRVLIIEMWRLETHWQRQFQILKKQYAPLVENILESGKKTGEFYSTVDSRVVGTLLFNAIAFTSIEWSLLHPKDSSKTMEQQVINFLSRGIIKQEE